MSHWTAVSTDAEALDKRQLLLARLLEYNASRGPEANTQPFCVSLFDRAGASVGGLYGTFMYDWLAIELLFVPEELRGQKLGSQLLADAEQHARDRGCIGAWLDTFSFQARGFYEKLGYSLAGEVPDHPIGGARYFMIKRWSSGD